MFFWGGGSGKRKKSHKYQGDKNKVESFLKKPAEYFTTIVLNKKNLVFKLIHFSKKNTSFFLLYFWTREFSSCPTPDSFAQKWQNFLNKKIWLFKRKLSGFQTPQSEKNTSTLLTQHNFKRNFSDFQTATPFDETKFLKKIFWSLDSQK